MKLRHTLISLPTEGIWLDGLLSHAPDVRALAIVLQPNAHHPARARESLIAATLQEAGFATLTMNLLTHYEESRDPDAHFNVPLLANRVLAAADWVLHQPPLVGLPIGLVSLGTASGAAIRAAAKSPECFGALACLGGRPDLAGAAPLRTLVRPVRFIVGSQDEGLEMLRQAYDLITATRSWKTLDSGDFIHADDAAIRSGASLATEWLIAHLPERPPAIIEPPTAGVDAPLVSPSATPQHPE